VTEWSRYLSRWDVLRAVSVALAVVWIAFVAAYLLAAASTQFTPGAVTAAVAALVIAGAGILYAWREPAPNDR